MLGVYYITMKIYVIINNQENKKRTHKVELKHSFH
jgi:hypothetical protein